MFGSDFPYLSPDRWLREFELLDIRDNVRPKVLLENAKRVLKLSDTKLDRISIINGVEVKPIIHMLDKVDWDWFYEIGIPSYFHGDLQPDNILYDTNNDKFVLIDWRHRFGNDSEFGDIYYDLGQLYHAIMINGQSILKDMFSYKEIKKLSEDYPNDWDFAKKIRSMVDDVHKKRKEIMGDETR